MPALALFLFPLQPLSYNLLLLCGEPGGLIMTLDQNNQEDDAEDYGRKPFGEQESFPAGKARDAVQLEQQTRQ